MFNNIWSLFGDSVKMIVLFLACFTLSFVCGTLMIFPNYSIASGSSSNTSVGVELSSAIALSVSPGVLDLQLQPTPDAGTISGDISVHVSTNNHTGYTLTMSTSTISTNLVSQYDDETITSHSNATPDIPDPLNKNTWGYNTSSSETLFLSIPSLEAPAIIAESESLSEDQVGVTIGARVDTTIPSGRYSNTLIFTSTTNFVPVPGPQEEFLFTIDTRMINTPFDMNDTPETNPTHFSGHDTSFSIPTRSFVGGTSEHSYSWIVNWGDGTPEERVSGVSGMNAPNDRSATHDYQEAGEYQITIRSDGPAEDGWMNAFGSFHDNSSSCFSANSMIKSIDSPVPKLARSSIATYRFAGMFKDLCNVTSLPGNLFSLIKNTNTNLTGMFSHTFETFSRNSTAFAIPSELFDSIDTANVTNFSDMFSFTFSSYETEFLDILIPADLFSFLDTTGAINLSGMFDGTFSGFAANSKTAAIPEGLFDSIDPANATDLSYMFSGTFQDFSRGSLVLTIPAGIFRTIRTPNAIDMAGMFQSTFLCSHINDSQLATIPADLFSEIDTSSADDLSNMFAGTFEYYGINSTLSASIPAGLFDSIDTTNARYLSAMFSLTFFSAANRSSLATIPSGLFDHINTANATDVSLMFQSTFEYYGLNSHADNIIPANLFSSIDLSSAESIWGMFNNTFHYFGSYSSSYTDVASIWGDADFAGKVTQYNATGIFSQTFSNMDSLTGYAQSFIDEKLGGIVPNSRAFTFEETSVYDLNSLDSNWK